MPTWTVLVATIGRRASKFGRLLDVLLPQTEPYAGGVLVEALWNNGETSLAAVRQALVEHAEGDYVSFVDDDDLVPEYYVDEVFDALESGPDQVGWQMQCWVDDAPLKPTYHSLRYAGWFEDDNGFYRDVSHLNPVRRELALLCDFRRGEPPEDVAWVEQLRPHVRTERYVDRIMYHYRSSPSDTTWRPGSVDPRDSAYVRLAVEHPNFVWHPWSFTQQDIEAKW